MLQSLIGGYLLRWQLGWPSDSICFWRIPKVFALGPVVCVWGFDCGYGWAQPCSYTVHLGNESAEVLGRPHIHYYEYWAYIQYKPVARCQYSGTLIVVSKSIRFRTESWDYAYTTNTHTNQSWPFIDLYVQTHLIYRVLFTSNCITISSKTLLS